MLPAVLFKIRYPAPVSVVFSNIGVPNASLLLSVISLLDGHLLVNVPHGTQLPRGDIIANNPLQNNTFTIPYR